MFSHLAFLYSFNWDHVLFILSIVEFGFYLYFFFFSFLGFLSIFGDYVGEPIMCFMGVEF
jgi:hypothetical protein